VLLLESPDDEDPDPDEPPLSLVLDFDSVEDDFELDSLLSAFLRDSDG
jgi:hypothetical protein